MRLVLVLGGKGTLDRLLRQRGTIQREPGHVDLAGEIEPLAPNALAVTIKMNLESGSLG
jgi:hypothetical protein